MGQVFIEYMGKRTALPLGETLLGRHSDCVFRFDDPSVSRRHARLIRRQDEVFIEDLGSANGTLLNGRTVAAPIRICDGDVVTVGNRTIKVLFGDRWQDDESTMRVSIVAAQAAEHERGRRMGTLTAQMASVVPTWLTADERCPRCSAVVRTEDQTCGNCNYHWGTASPATAGGLNRRLHERYAEEIHVAYASRLRQFEATTLDISANGLFLCTQELDPVGTPCRLTLSIDNVEIRVGGVVRRVCDPETTHPELVGVGVELLDVGGSERALLSAFLAELKAD